MYQPKYTISNAILRNVSLIEAAREVVENAAIVPHWEAQFRKDAVVRTVHYGTHLEGNPLSKEQVERIVEVDDQGQRTKDEGRGEYKPSTFDASGVVAKERDIQEVLNYREVLKFIDSRGVPVESPYGRIKVAFSPYTIETLQEVHRLTSHKILSESEQGFFRTAQVVIRNRATQEVIYRPPPAPAVAQQITEFLEWLNSIEGRQNHHPVVRAGITHWELVRIHPFTDGNGRTARAVALLVLFQEGYDVKRFFSIEQYYDQNPTDYYEALATAGANLGGDVTSWLEYFTDGLAIELSRVKDRVLALSRDLKLKGRLGQQIALTDRQIKILEFIEVNGGMMTMADTMKFMPTTSRDTILRELMKLVKKGLVRKVGVTKGARYILV